MDWQNITYLIGSVLWQNRAIPVSFFMVYLVSKYS